MKSKPTIPLNCRTIRLNRVDLYVDSNDLTKFYGDAQGVLDGLDSKERNTLTGLVNGDEKKEDSIRTDIGIKNSSPAVYTKDGKSYTKDVGDYVYCTHKCGHFLRVAPAHKIGQATICIL